jgi:Lecithin retinol acyltransferase
MRNVLRKLNLKPGDRIIVPKSGLKIIQHHALYFGQNHKGQDLIAENKIGFGVRLVSALDSFKDVNEITSIEKFEGGNYERKLIIQRAIQKMGQPYDLINYNCQHFANEVQYGKVESEQVQSFFSGVKWVSGFLLLFILINSIAND